MPTFGKTVRPWMKPKPAQRWSGEVAGNLPKNFYRCAPWRNLRQRQLEKQPLCEECKKNRKLEPATVVDHIKPIRLGGEPLDEDNLRSLCASCHNTKSAKERNQSGKY